MLELRSSDTVVARVTGPPTGTSVPGVTLFVPQSSGVGALAATMTAFEMAGIGA